MRTIPLWALGLLVAGAPQVAGQGCEAGSAGVFDTVRVTAGVRVSDIDGHLDPDATVMLGVAIAGHFVAPQSAGTLLPMPRWLFTGQDGRRRTTTSRILAAEVRLDARGRLVLVAVETPSGDRALDSTLVRAIQEADAFNELRGLATGVPRRLRLALVAGSDLQAMHPLFAVSTPVRIVTGDVDVPATRIKGPAPRYPAAKMGSGVAGLVRLRFVVSAQGQADPESIEVMSFNDVAFVEPAKTAVLESTFRPARVKDCPVAQLVEQNIRFTFSRRGRRVGPAGQSRP